MTSTITPKLIKELRDRTGIGMSKCKEALAEANGDIEVAIDNLRKAGMATAVKKEGRETKEGLIVSAENEKTIVLVEVMAETDFVVNNEQFGVFLRELAEEAVQSAPASLEDFLAQPFKGGNETVEQQRATMVQTFGENIQITRLKVLSKTADNSIGVYLHLGGKIGCIVELGGGNQEADFAKELAMHVAAAAPEFVSPDSVPADVIAREQEIAREQMQGKPENIIEKILEGKLRAFYDDVCFTNQKFIKDDSKSINELVAARGKEKGISLTVKDFTRWSVKPE